LNNVEFNFFILAHTLLVFVRVVFGNSALVNENVLVGIIPLIIFFLFK